MLTGYILIFKLICLVAMFFSLIIICFRNPIFSIFSLIAALLNAIILLLLFEVEFLAYVYFIVYVGAIAVLFLFVVMLLNIKGEENIESGNFYSFKDWSLNIFLVLKLISVIYMLSEYAWYVNLNYSLVSTLCFKVTDIIIFSTSIYSTFFFNFILVGIILLVSMIGTLVLATNK